MSTHIGAEPGQIAPTVLLPGDPLRAKWIAETFLEDATCYSEVRGMLGFTGTWHGRARSRCRARGWASRRCRSTLNELFSEYDVQTGRPGRVVRRLHRERGPARRRHRAGGLHRLLDEPAALPRPRLRADRRLRPAARRGRRRRGALATSAHHVGLIFSGDTFYNPREELMEPMVAHGVDRGGDGGERALHARGVVRPARRWPSAPSATTSSPARRPAPRTASRPSPRWSTSLSALRSRPRSG